MVEAPGTAPGSDRFITVAVYRHSQPLRVDPLNIGGAAAVGKGRCIIADFEHANLGSPVNRLWTSPIFH